MLWFDARRRWVLIPALATALVAIPGLVHSDQNTKGAREADKARKKAEMASATKVTIHDAIKAASEQVSGQVIEAELEEKPRVTWEVEVVTNEGKVMEVWVDIDTGAVVATKEKEAEKDEGGQEIQQPTSGCRGDGMMHGGGMHPRRGQATR